MSVWPAVTPSRCANSALSGSTCTTGCMVWHRVGVRRAARPDRRRVRNPARVRPGRTTRRRPARASPPCHTPVVARPGRGTTWPSTPLPQRHSVLRRRSPSRPCGPSGADLERLHPALAGGVPSSTALVLADAFALWTGRARLGRVYAVRPLTELSLYAADRPDLLGWPRPHPPERLRTALASEHDEGRLADGAAVDDVRSMRARHPPKPAEGVRVRLH